METPVECAQATDNSIAQALQAAETAKKEVSLLHVESEKILAEAKAEPIKSFWKPVNSKKRY